MIPYFPSPVCSTALIYIIIELRFLQNRNVFTLKIEQSGIHIAHMQLFQSKIHSITVITVVDPRGHKEHVSHPKNCTRLRYSNRAVSQITLIEQSPHKS